MEDNDDAGPLNEPVARPCFASKLAPASPESDS
ncbi:MAG: hypothetical protein JWP42_1275 [Pseudomonas sp.]|nr:hypothetical protein [Pseudomonas sp.]